MTVHPTCRPTYPPNVDPEPGVSVESEASGHLDQSRLGSTLPWDR